MTRLNASQDQSHRVQGNVCRTAAQQYCVEEQVADKSHAGFNDTDASAYFKAYVQAIDTGKHGNRIALPEHLREQVGRIWLSTFVIP